MILYYTAVESSLFFIPSFTMWKYSIVTWTQHYLVIWHDMSLKIMWPLSYLFCNSQIPKAELCDYKQIPKVQLKIRYDPKANIINKRINYDISDFENNSHNHIFSQDKIC